MDIKGGESTIEDKLVVAGEWVKTPSPSMDFLDVDGNNVRDRDWRANTNGTVAGQTHV